jgi:RNA polymerase sigma-70 factor (ECF subfamily)
MDNEPLDNKEMLESTKSFETAYKSHSKSIYKFLYWRTNDVQLSEDLTSSTFEKAWVSRKSFQGGSAQAWLYRIARNVLIDHWRKKKDLPINDADTVRDDAQTSIEDSLDSKLQVQYLQRALLELPDDMRSVVNLRFIEGLSCKQVAINLNLSESNVRVIQYRALKKLRDYLI